VTGADFDGDGYSDLAAGAPAGDGAVWVYAGGAGGLSAGATAALTGAAGAALGAALAAADLDGDGRAELIVGAPGLDRAEVYAGAPAGLEQDAWLLLSAEESGGALGSAVSDAGDADGDGLLDVAAGDPLGFGAAGGAWIFFGAP